VAFFEDANAALFVFAIVAVIINGTPQFIYTEARGFAIKPAGFAFLIGALGNLITGSVTPISGQAMTITIASMKKNLRNNVSAIMFAAIVMMVLSALGGVTWIVDFAGPAVIAGMMSGGGLIMAGVATEMYTQDKRTAMVSIVAAVIAYALFLESANRVVWVIFISVVLSSLDFLLLQKRRVDVTEKIYDRDSLRMSNEWRFWKKIYWQEFRLIKPTFNMTVLISALSIVMLNIGSNISFGAINASIAGTTQHFDHLAFINAIADIPSAIFGGPPIEPIISGTAGAPWPVAAGIAFMLVMGLLLLLGMIGRLGRFLPAQSITGFLLVLGFAFIFAPNITNVAGSDHPMAGFFALGITVWSKNMFFGIVAGILVRYFGTLVGLG